MIEQPAIDITARPPTLALFKGKIDKGFKAPEFLVVQEKGMMIQQPAIDITSRRLTLSFPKGKIEKGFISQILVGF